MSSALVSGPLSTLEIHLDAVAWNYRFLKAQLKTDTACGAVVKADAYGLGAAEVSKILYAEGCRDFFVAHFEEGLAVRAACPAPGAAIYVLHGPHAEDPEAFTAHSLTPVLNTPEDITFWLEFCRSSGKRHPAVLHIDTGMNRLGLSATEASRLTPEDLRGLDLRCVMSHLACTDDPAHPKNAEQLALFRKLTAGKGLAPRLSLANSGGLLFGTDYQFDLVRPGCGLYGINPHPQRPNPVKNAVTLKARILQVRQIDSKGTVGYGASYTVVPPVKYATVSAGYADGYFRSLTGHGTLVVGGRKCPVVGRVSMDSVVVDVTGIEPAPQPGDWAEIIGTAQSADEVAQQAGTIGYEVLTALGKRHKRFYTGAST